MKNKLLKILAFLFIISSIISNIIFLVDDPITTGDMLSYVDVIYYVLLIICSAFIFFAMMSNKKAWIVSSFVIYLGCLTVFKLIYYNYSTTNQIHYLENFYRYGVFSFLYIVLSVSILLFNRHKVFQYIAYILPIFFILNYFYDYRVLFEHIEILTNPRSLRFINDLISRLLFFDLVFLYLLLNRIIGEPDDIHS